MGAANPGFPGAMGAVSVPNPLAGLLGLQQPAGLAGGGVGVAAMGAAAVGIPTVGSCGAGALPTIGKKLLLRNMVGPEDVDEYLEGEVEEECSKHGPVSKVKITFEDQDGVKVVLVAVEFETEEAAAKARAVMHGRLFAGRTVRAEVVAAEAGQ